MTLQTKNPLQIAGDFFCPSDTVNGMEACTTFEIYRQGYEEFQNRKRYGSMHDSTPCGRRRNATKIDVLERDFRAAIFDCVFPETLSDEIHKRLVFVDMTPFVAFGKCFAKMASVRTLQSLSNFKFTGAIYITSLPKLQEKFLP